MVDISRLGHCAMIAHCSVMIREPLRTPQYFPMWRSRNSIETSGLSVYQCPGNVAHVRGVKTTGQPHQPRTSRTKSCRDALVESQ